MLYKIGMFLIGIGLKLISKSNNEIYKQGVLSVDILTFDGLLETWKHRARRLLCDAPKDKSTITATKAMEHDAIIFINCVNELKKVLSSL